MPAPLRPTDFSSVLGAEENQVVSVFELLARKGLLFTENVVECERCQNLMLAKDFFQAVDDEDEFECTGCGRAFPVDAEPISVYRMTIETLGRIKAAAQRRNGRGHEMFGGLHGDEPLSDRAQLVLIAMLELGARDSDIRKSTEEIAIRALGAQADGNSLKIVMSELHTRRLIETKAGRGGGCWLTGRGLARAEKLRN